MESLESSPGPTELNRNETQGTPNSAKRFALAGCLLSLVPILVAVLAYVFNAQLFPPTPELNYYETYDSYNSQYLQATLILAAVSLVSIASALQLSQVALRRIQQYPPLQMAWRNLATVGRILGMIGIGAVVVGAPCLFCGLVAVNYHGG